jgi:hypothetical protein
MEEITTIQTDQWPTPPGSSPFIRHRNRSASSSAAHFPSLGSVDLQFSFRKALFSWEFASEGQKQSSIASSALSFFDNQASPLE